MPDFAYIARNITGQRVEGTVAAGSEREALASLAARELFPLKVTTDKNAVVASQTGEAIKVKSAIVAPVYSQLAALLRSGVPLLRSLRVLREQTSNKNLGAVLDDIVNRVEEGSTLADAMARNPKAFDELSVSIVRAGGEGGFLEEALERVATFTEQQGELRSRVVGALAYPAVLFSICVLAVAGLMILVVPNFKEIFDDLASQGKLPAVTHVLLAISEFVGSIYGGITLALIVGLLFFANQHFKTEEGRELLDRWRIKMPVAGSIYLSLAVARFCRVFGTLLSGGVPIVRALDVSADSTGNKVLIKSIRDAAENISSGESLADPLGESGHFPTNVVEMIAVAEQSNTLETVLTQIADSLEKQTWRKLDLTVRLLEPVMLVVLAIIVLFVVSALMLPILNMGNTL